MASGSKVFSKYLSNFYLFQKRIMLSCSSGYFSDLFKYTKKHLFLYFEVNY